MAPPGGPWESIWGPVGPWRTMGPVEGPKGLNPTFYPVDLASYLVK